MYIYELLEGDETIRSSMVEPLWHNLATCRCVNGGLVKKKIKKDNGNGGWFLLRFICL